MCPKHCDKSCNQLRKTSKANKFQKPNYNLVKDHECRLLYLLCYLTL